MGDELLVAAQFYFLRTSNTRKDFQIKWQWLIFTYQRTHPTNQMDSRSLSHTTGYLRGHLERFPSFMWRLNQVFQNKTSLFLTPNYNRCFLRLNRACAQLCDESEIEKNQFKRPVLICGCISNPSNTDASRWQHSRQPQSQKYLLFLMTNTKKELKDWGKHVLTHMCGRQWERLLIILF